MTENINVVKLLYKPHPYCYFNKYLKYLFIKIYIKLIYYNIIYKMNTNRKHHLKMLKDTIILSKYFNIKIDNELYTILKNYMVYHKILTIKERQTVIIWYYKIKELLKKNI